jgi:hypothetical protein
MKTKEIKISVNVSLLEDAVEALFKSDKLFKDIEDKKDYAKERVDIFLDMFNDEPEELLQWIIHEETSEYLNDLEESFKEHEEMIKELE